jgi:hypothetical protein
LTDSAEGNSFGKEIARTTPVGNEPTAQSAAGRQSL